MSVFDEQPPLIDAKKFSLWLKKIMIFLNQRISNYQD